MENKSKTSSKKIIFGIVALAAVIVLFAVIYNVYREKPVEGGKSITIEVVDGEQKSTVYELKTDAEYFRQAMEETEGLTFSGTEIENLPSISVIVPKEVCDTPAFFRSSA